LDVKPFCWISHPIIDFLCGKGHSISTIAIEFVVPFLFTKVCEAVGLGQAPSVPQTPWWRSVHIHMEKNFDSGEK
jgi:hypothetical protein